MNAIHTNIKIDQIIRSNRKTISLELKRDGVLVVRAPTFASRGQIEELVNLKASWIRKKQNLLRQQSSEAPAKQFISGEEYLYLGEHYPLEIVKEQTAPLILQDKFYLAEKSRNEAKLVFTKWYRKQASLFIKKLVERRALQNGFSYKLIRITSAKKRWGSCGPKGSLNFSWRMIMAPPYVIEYVVVHELVHLKIKNHSKTYWDEVRKLIPGYRLHRSWLKENGYRLTLD